jgi:hypothetical protein
MERMLSLERCRKLLGPENTVPDEKLVTLRDQLYCLAELVLDLRDSSQKVDLSVDGAFEQIAGSNEDPNALKERAAIIEFDGKVSRGEAERRAIEMSLASESVN